MNMTRGSGIRLLFLIVALTLLAPCGTTLAQWDIKWHTTLDKDIIECAVVHSGHFDNPRTQQLVACLTEKTGEELAIIDGATGEIKWKGEQYYKIFRESIHVADVDGDGRDEIVFAAQNTPKSSVALYLIAALGKSFTETPQKKSSAPPAPVATTTSAPPPTPSTSTPASTTASATGSTAPAANAAPASPPPPAEPPRTLQAGTAADISYQIAAPDSVSIEIYNGSGDLVKTLFEGTSPAGSFTKTWDGTDNKGARVLVGPYFYTVSIGKSAATRKKVSFR